MIPSCRKTSELLSAQQDRPLGRMERVALAAHLALCRRCRVVARQFEFLRVAARHWRDLE